jgi:hypothetical protein
LALDRKIKCFNFIGDSDLVLSQVKSKFSTKNERLRKYRDLVQDTIELFASFSINVFHGEKNYVIYSLTISSSTLQPCEEVLQDL